jgi:hypothetical protein
MHTTEEVKGQHKRLTSTMAPAASVSTGEMSSRSRLQKGSKHLKNLARIENRAALGLRDREASKRQREGQGRAILQGEAPGGFLRGRVRGEVIVEVGRVQRRRHDLTTADAGETTATATPPRKDSWWGEAAGEIGCKVHPAIHRIECDASSRTWAASQANWAGSFGPLASVVHLHQLNPGYCRRT